MTWTKVVTGGVNGAKTISITPPKDGTHTLQVRTVDKADNKSEPVSYTFHAGPGGFVQPAEGERTARRLPLVAEADGAKCNNVSFSWRRSEADAWVTIPAGDVTSGGTPLTAWPAPLVNGKNAALVWNATDTVNPDGTVQSRAPALPSGPTASSVSRVPRRAWTVASAPAAPRPGRRAACGWAGAPAGSAATSAGSPATSSASGVVRRTSRTATGSPTSSGATSRRRSEE